MEIPLATHYHQRHNYWIKQEKIEAIYDKKLLEKEELEENILKIKDGKISGMNVTLPFKKLGSHF